MSDSSPRILSLVAIPAVITLIVTVLRLVGELQGWNSSLFNPEAGGGGAPIGITWLVLVFGFWFGARLSRTGAGPSSLGRATMTYVVAMVAMAGGLVALIQAGLVTLPSEENPGPLEGLPYFMAVLGVTGLIGLFAWPRLSMTLIVYGLLARLPVVLLTYMDVFWGWETHYGALPPGAVAESDNETFIALVTPQLTLWPLVFTPVVGGLFGCIGAAVLGGKRG